MAAFISITIELCYIFRSKSLFHMDINLSQRYQFGTVFSSIVSETSCKTAISYRSDFKLGQHFSDFPFCAALLKCGL